MRDLGSLVCVREIEPGGSAVEGRSEELGGSESGLDSTPYGLLEAMARVLRREGEVGQKGSRKYERGKLKAVSYTKGSRKGVVMFG